MRAFTKILLNREERTDPFPPLPTQAELDAFSRNGAGGPTAVDFRIDVSGKNKHSPWNQRAALVFAREYLKEEFRVTDSLHLVKKAFLSHISALCSQYQNIQGLVVL